MEVGDTVPLDDMTLATLDGSIASMRELLTTNQRKNLAGGDPVAIIAGSIT